MLLGVISDTHDRLPTFRRAISLFRRLRVDAILHAGDLVAPFAAKLIAPAELAVPTHVIYGNNDGERAGLKKILPHIVDGPLTLDLAGHKVVMHHFADWLPPEAVRGADVVVSGHNHQASKEERDGVLYLNPGECCGWVTDRCTVATLELSPERHHAPKAEIIEVHE
ncbi:MAG: metallophosphoesterase [Planctomycetota bacterium]